MPFWDRNVIAYDSIKMVFNAFEEVKLKWYQTGFFQFVTIVVSIAITIVSGGLSSFVGALMGAVSAGVVALGIFVAKILISAVVAKYAFSFVAEQLGAELAAILATIAIVYGAVGSFGSNSQLFNLPMASDFLNLGLGLGEGIQQQLANELLELQNDFTALNADIADKQEELDKVNDSFQHSIDPFNIFQPLGLVPGETPSEYISRKIEIKNPGILAIDALHSYVERNLQLPTKD